MMRNPKLVERANTRLELPDCKVDIFRCAEL